MMWHNLTHKHFALCYHEADIEVEFCIKRFTNQFPVKSARALVDGYEHELEGTEGYRLLRHIGEIDWYEIDHPRIMIARLINHVKAETCKDCYNVI